MQLQNKEKLPRFLHRGKPNIQVADIQPLVIADINVWGCKALIPAKCRAVKQANLSKKIRCGRVGSTETSRFHLLTLALTQISKEITRNSLHMNWQLFWCIFFVLRRWEKVSFSGLKTGLQISHCKHKLLSYE